MSDSNPQLAQTVRGLEGLNALFQHRSRLGAVVLLSTTDALNFSRLKDLLKETNGNLGAQLRKLEEAGYVKVNKSFEDRKPISWYTLTRPGRDALNKHLGAMEVLINQPMNSQRSK